MVLLADEGYESRNLGRGRAHQEMETKEGNSEDCGQEGGGGGEMGGGEIENGINGDVSAEEIKDIVMVYDDDDVPPVDDVPPADDVCPICFDRFTIPCRSNCGHWFCASCILQFWMFRSSIQPCNCPLCCCRIVNLKPETSHLTQPPADIDELLRKIHQYNGLYISGVIGAFNRIQALPLFMGRVIRILIDPDGLRCTYYVMRLVGLFLAVVYERGEFEFVPTGGYGIQRTFDLSATMFIMTFFLVGIVYRWMDREHAAAAAALGPWD